MKGIIAVILILSVTFSSAVFVRKPTKHQFAVLSQLNEIRDTTFGKKLLDTIALQLQSDNAMNDISNMLKKIEKDLNMQLMTGQRQNDLDQKECVEVIEKQNILETTCTGNFKDAEEQIGIYKSNIKELSAKIENYQVQLDLLAGRKVHLTKAREHDHNEYLKRQEQGPGVIEALGVIVDKLSTIAPVDDKAAMAQLAKIGGANPIASFLTVASTFSKETLDRIIGKLVALRDQIQDALDHDEENEHKAVEQFKLLIAEIEETSKKVQATLTSSKTELKNKQNSLEIQEKRREEAGRCVDEAQKTRAKWQEDCASKRAAFEKEQMGMNQELEVIKKVINIIATKLDTMKSYLQEEQGQ